LADRQTDTVQTDIVTDFRTRRWRGR